MFIQMKTFQIEKGNAERFIERFAGEGIIEKQPGFISLSVLEQLRTKEADEVKIMIMWENESDWKAWEKSPIHIQGHRERKNDQKPSFILDSNQSYYNVIGSKGPVV
ncbi:MAG: antibiotic biosynthesis monooxygenase [Bacilli bacterium]